MKKIFYTALLQDFSCSLSFVDGPQVKVPTYQEVAAGDTLVVKCDVMSKPPPHMIQWMKEGDPYFRQLGDTLRIDRISVDDGGRYICQAATSFRPSGSNIQTEATGNGTVTVRIKRKNSYLFILYFS